MMQEFMADATALDQASRATLTTTYITQGWQCPACKRVMAPFQPYCLACYESPMHSRDNKYTNFGGNINSNTHDTSYFHGLSNTATKAAKCEAQLSFGDGLDWQR